MARPGGENAQKDDVPWWMRYGGRLLGTVGGFMAIILGLFSCIGIVLLNVYSLIAGIWQMMAGFLVLVGEAPCCCFFIDFVQAFSDKMESRPYWNKAVLYVCIALPPFFLNFFSVSTWLGSGAIFGTGIIYGMMALGKKASVEDMRSSAANLEAGKGQPSSAPRANLVMNEQPISMTLPARN